MNRQINQDLVRAANSLPENNPVRLILDQGNSVSLEQLISPNDNKLVSKFSIESEGNRSSHNIKTFLLLAIQIVTAVQESHTKKIINGFINPSNILFEAVSPEKGAGIQARILKINHAKNINLDKQLAYISPEQTGRLNRLVDHRTDLYTLGIIFYKMITGQLPFEAKDPLSLVHAHISIKPIPPIQRSPDLPQPLSDIILKLLAKDPRQRFQSATGLLTDLQKCLTEWEYSGQVKPFTLAETDVSERLLIPEKLFGRQEEFAQLVNRIEEVKKGDSRLLLLSGGSGVGKTTLIDNLMEPVIAGGGLMLKYWAEKPQNSTPYSAAIGILKDFVQQIRVKEPDQIVIWRKKLIKALAGNVAQLIKQIPELGLLLSMPLETHSAISDPQLLFRMALQNFLAAIASVERPLVIVIDDIQSADVDSLQLFRNLIIKSSQFVLVIWVYRNDEPVPHFLQDIIASVTRDHQLNLSPLDLTATSQFLAETLNASIRQVAELAQLLHTKTGGNPFFLRELVRSLHDQALIYFNIKQQIWSWNLEKIQSIPLADNIASLVRERLQLLPASEQQLLKIAAYLGNRFEIDQLAAVLQETPETVNKKLANALNLGAVTQLITSTSLSFSENNPIHSRVATMQQMTDRYMAIPNVQDRNGSLPPEKTKTTAVSAPAYQFTHEQIWHAAQLLLPELTAESIHWQIGWHLWQSMATMSQPANYSLLVSHLNQALTQEVARPNRLSIAELNLRASHDAFERVAYENAWIFAQRGMSWLGGDVGWQDTFHLMRDLHMTASQAAARLGQFEQAESLLDKVEEHATSVPDRVAVTQERMLACYIQGKHEAAIEAAISALEQLGVPLPQQTNKLHIALALIRTEIALFRKTPEDLAGLPPMTDVLILKSIEIMAAATVSAAAVNPNLLMLMGLEIVRRTLKHGSHPLSAMGYALYGVLLCGTIGQIKRGYAFGQLAMRLVPIINVKEYRVFVKYFVNAYIKHWKEPIYATLQPIRDISTTGEFEYLAVAAGLYPYLTWFINSMDLSTSDQGIAESMHLLDPFKDTAIYYRYQLGQQYYRNLLGRAENPCQIVGAVYDERLMLPVHLRENDHTTIFFLACHKLTLCYLFEDYESAIEASDLATTHSQGGLGTPLIPVLNFYDSLARLALYPTVSSNDARGLLKIVAANQGKMRRWARFGPANCLHRFTLVEAERARVLGQNGRARELYDEAIQQAQAHDYLPEIAIIHEAAGRFYLSIGQTIYADHHITQAYQNYRTWGALGKLKQIKGRFPWLFLDTPVDTIHSIAGLSAYLDVTTILKATQALSRETQLPRLMDMLTRILIENAAAQYGCLLLLEGNQWQVVSKGNAPGIDGSQPSQKVAAMSIVWQVARTQEPVLLHDATAIPSSDPYLQAIQPQSILCLPLLDKGELVGVFYMENRLTQHAFSPERLPFLTMLASQAAISLKNASLVAGLLKAQEKIRTSKNRFRLLFENAPLGILEFDITTATPKIRTVNRRAEAQYGFSASEFMLLDPIQLAPEANRQEILNLIDTVREGKTAIIESTHQRRDGSIFPVRIIATPAHQQDDSLQMIVVVEDITAQQHHQSEVAAIEEERRRIAHEIHDGVVQNLAFLRLKLALWNDWIISEPERIQTELSQSQAVLDETLAEIRRSIYALRPLALDTRGLTAVLPHYVTDFNEQNKIYVTLQIKLAENLLTIHQELLLFRVIQEGLNNMTQHAEASLAWINLSTKDDSTILLTIRDNGRGFQTSSLAAAARFGHLGLIQMQERVEQAGGRLLINSQPDQGTEIQIELPKL